MKPGTEPWLDGITKRQWERYDRTVDKMDVDELRSTLKREARIRAVHEKAGRAVHYEVSAVLFRLKAVAEGTGPRGASTRVMVYVGQIWRRLDEAHREYVRKCGASGL